MANVADIDKGTATICPLFLYSLTTFLSLSLSLSTTFHQGKLPVGDTYLMMQLQRMARGDPPIHLGGNEQTSVSRRPGVPLALKQSLRPSRPVAALV